MFTPKRQRQGPGALRTPRARGSELRMPNPTGKSKAVALDDGPLPPPPRGFLNDNGDTAEGENMEDWRRFQEVGLLDKAAMEKGDYEALLDKAERLEREIEKTLHEMRAEYAEVKVAADCKFAESKSMVEDSLRKLTKAEEKMRAAESLEAEATRYHRTAEMKLHEVEDHEDDVKS